MTYQEFNNIYYLFTKEKRGVKPWDRLNTTGDELKEFVEFAIKKLQNDADRNQTQMHLIIPQT